MDSVNYQLMEAFEQAWRAVDPTNSYLPEWRDFILKAEELDLLLYVLEMDIEQRARRGLPGIIAQRYWEHPAIAGRLQDEQKIELIRGELEQLGKSRSKQDSNSPRDPALDIESALELYASAFPGLATHLNHDSIFPKIAGKRTPVGRNSEIVLNSTRRSEQPAMAGDLLGPYKLLQRIGEGGMGEVWMAEQKEPVKRRVALKLIKHSVSGSRQILARFEAERQALSLMNHPNIARIVDAGTTDFGQPFFVIELVAGRPITEYCDQNNLSIEQRLRLFSDVCGGVQHAHQKGIVHRDLKPSNILVGQVDGQAVAKIIDFGLAKALANNQQLTDQSLFTGIGQLLGTLRYMSPEQASLNTLDIDTRTDIYALGVILYELLTGSTPIDEESLKGQAAFKLLELIRDQEPLRPSSRLSNSKAESVSKVSAQRRIETSKLARILSGDLDWVVMKALEKDRSRRYESASGLAADINRYLAGEPVVARPPSFGYRTMKFIRRNRAGVIAASLLLLFLVGGTAGTLLGLLRARGAEKVAEDRRLGLENALESLKQALDSESQALVRESTARKVAIAAERAALAEKQAATKALARSRYLFAMARWSDRRSVDAQKLLAQVSPEFRDFAWHYASREFEGSKLTLYGHASEVMSVSLSPDGSRMISGGFDGQITVWNLQTGGEILSFPGHTGGVEQVAFDPNGTQFASSGRDELIKVWDGTSGRELSTLKGHRGEVFCIAFSPDGKRLASAGRDKAVKIWNVQTGEEMNNLAGHRFPISSLAFDPVGNTLASGSWDRTVKVWDLESAQEMASLTGHAEGIACVGYSPDGARLIVGDYANSLKLWDLASKRELKTLSGHVNSVLSARFSPDGKLIASGGFDHTLRIWDAESGEPIETLAGHNGGISSLAFTPDGSRLVSGSLDKTIKIWSIVSLTSNERLEGHMDLVSSVEINKAGTQLVSASSDGTIRLWNTEDGKETRVFRGHESAVLGALFVGSGNRIVSCGQDHTIRVWDVETGAELKKLKGHTAEVFQIAASPDGRQFVSAGLDNALKIWDIEKQEPLLTLTGHRSWAGAIAYSPDGRQIASGGTDKQLKVWDAVAGKEVKSISGHEETITCIAYSPNGTRIATGSTDSNLRIWDVASGKLVRVLKGHSDTVFGAAFSADGNQLVSGSSDRTLKLWDVEQGELLRTLTGHEGPVRKVVFSSDNQQIASASKDKTLKLWSAFRDSERRILAGHLSPVVGLKFSRDGKYLFSEDETGDKKTWDCISGAAVEAVSLPGSSTQSSRSADGRWFAIAEAEQIVLVDREFKNQPRERSRRRQLTECQLSWHRQRASQLEATEDWYAATFHRAWAVKGKPDSTEDQAALKTNWAKLEEKNPTLAQQLRHILPSDQQPRLP